MPDSSTAFAAFEADITAGLIPDIIVLPMENYGAEKLQKYLDIGLLTDLYPLLDAAGFARNGLTDAVKAVCERDGTLPCLPMRLNLETCYSTTLTGDMTFDRMLELIAASDREHPVMRGLSIYGMQSHVLKPALDEFVNFDTGSVNFDTDSFKKFLAIYRRAAKDEFFVSGDGAYLITSCSAKRPATLANLMAQYGDALAFVGRPSADGRGVIASAQTVWAITEACADKMGAAALLVERLSDDYMLIEYDIDTPMVTRSSYEKFCEKTAAETYTFGAHEVAGADAVALMESLMADTRAYLPGTEAVMDIIAEELSAFVGQNLSEAEVIARLNSRVGLYVSERAK